MNPTTGQLAEALLDPREGTTAIPDLGPGASDLRVLRGMQQAVQRPVVRNWLIVVAALFAVLVAQLMVSILLAQGSYETSALQTKQKQLSRTTQELTEKLNAYQSPQYLSEEAIKLGMVNSQPAKFLRLSDAKVLGTNEIPEGAKALTKTEEVLVASSVIGTQDAQSADADESDGAQASANQAEIGAAAEAAAQPTSSTSKDAESDGAPQWLPSVADVDLGADRLPTPVTR